MSYFARSLFRATKVFQSRPPGPTAYPSNIRHYSSFTPKRSITTTVNVNPDVQRVLTFWFDRNPIEWIIAPEGLDDQIKTDFGDLVLQARRDELDDWITASPESSVALVVLLDQFCRNLFRGNPRGLLGRRQGPGRGHPGHRPRLRQARHVLPGVRFLHGAAEQRDPDLGDCRALSLGRD
ncbi:hypothetical protein PG994_012689 [Apiospora phragmitis]|uniref:DUF924-domain-containing protein n=1 Tax=Apiospora phragmitis TaxID=2905665 RepID=A0ABR1TCZ0_9PEZI